jgi:hypothetical protein
MLRFHRTEYELNGRRMKSSWFQLGDRIWLHRQRAL